MKKSLKKFLSVLLITVMASTLIVGCNKSEKKEEEQVTTKDYSAEVKDLPAETAKVYMALASQCEVFSAISTQKYLSTTFSFEIKELGDSIENGDIIEGLTVSAGAGLTNGLLKVGAKVSKNSKDILDLTIGATDKCLLLSSSLLGDTNYKLELNRVAKDYNGSAFSQFLLNLGVPAEAILPVASSLTTMLPQLTNPDTIENFVSSMAGNVSGSTPEVDTEAVNKVVSDLKEALKVAKVEKQSESNGETIYKVTLTKAFAEKLVDTVYNNIMLPTDPESEYPSLDEYTEESILIGIAKNGSLSSITYNDEESGGKLQMTFKSDKISLTFKESSDEDSDEFYLTFSYKITKENFEFAVDEFKLVEDGDVQVSIGAKFKFSTEPIEVIDVTNYKDLLDLTALDIQSIYLTFASELTKIMQEFGINPGM